MQQEKAEEQVRSQDYLNRFEAARKSNLQFDVSHEGNLRSLESQLRTCKLDKSHMAIQLAEAERRNAEL